MSDMDKKLSGKILVLTSMLYGLGLAGLGWLKVDAVSTVAVVGAVVLGFLWVVRAMFVKGTVADDR